MWSIKVKVQLCVMQLLCQCLRVPVLCCCQWCRGDALNADEVNGLFRNPALTQIISVSNSYLPITSYTEVTYVIG